MRQQIKINSKFENLLFYILFITFAYFIVNSFGYTMPDDGWRHLAMALYPEQVQSWGRVYPYTLYDSYDPWFVWHSFLSFLNNFVNSDKLHIFVNTLIYSLLSLWYFLALKKFTKINIVFIIILALGLPILNFRYYYLRPDILSGLFLLYFILLNNKYILVLISIIYAPFYYVFWFYFAYLSCLKLFLKEYKKFLILIAASLFGFIFYLSTNFDGYINIMQNVLNNDTLLQGYAVGESKPFLLPENIKNSLGSSKTLLLLMLFSIGLYVVLKPTHLLLKYMILFLPLFLMQYRFLHLLEPLIYIFLIYIFNRSFHIIKEEGILKFLNLIKNFIDEKTYFSNFSKRTYSFISTLLLISFFLLQYKSALNSYKNISEEFYNNSFLKEDIYKNKKILITSMGLPSYLGVFFNPTGEYIPGCSLGWVKYDKKNTKTYFDLLTNNEKISKNDFFIFLNKNDPDYLIIDTLKTNKLILNNEELKKNGFLFDKIIGSKLIFRKIQ